MWLFFSSRNTKLLGFSPGPNTCICRCCAIVFTALIILHCTLQCSVFPPPSCFCSLRLMTRFMSDWNFTETKEFFFAKFQTWGVLQCRNPLPPPKNCTFLSCSTFLTKAQAVFCLLSGKHNKSGRLSELRCSFYSLHCRRDSRHKVKMLPWWVIYWLKTSLQSVTAVWTFLASNTSPWHTPESLTGVQTDSSPESPPCDLIRGPRFFLNRWQSRNISRFTPAGDT